MSLLMRAEGTVQFWRLFSEAWHASAPSSWSILGYKETTSIVTKILPSLTGMFFILFMKSVVSLM